MRHRGEARDPLYPPSVPIAPAACAYRRCTSCISRKAATPGASPWCSCTAAPAAAPTRRCAASSIRAAIASCCSTSAAAARARRTPASWTTPPGTWSPTSRSCANTWACERWQVFGGSWGSTLALAYAQRHPKRVTELVLRGIFLLRRSELEWFYQSSEGAASLFPDLWEKFVAPIPEAERYDMMRAYYRRLTSSDTRERNAAARTWSLWEAATSYLRASAADVAKFKAAGHCRGVRPHRVPLLRQRRIPRQRGPAAARRAPDPQHTLRDRAGSLRRGVPDAQRLAPASRLAQGEAGDRARCRAFGV